MNSSKIIYSFLFAVSIVLYLSCTVKRKEYIERNGLHSGQKPSAMAKEQATILKKQKRYYKREKRKQYRENKKRDRQRLKGNFFDE
jgi:hypothetical protein